LFLHITSSTLERISSALGYYGVKSKGKRSQEDQNLKTGGLGFYGAAMAGP
jgi:hypothetical protein